MTDIVERLKYGIIEYRKRWSGDTHSDLGGSVDYDATTDMLNEAADRIEALEARIARADALAEAVTHERELVCQDMGMQLDAACMINNALAAYREGSDT
jgi:hypothetical protein